MSVRLETTYGSIDIVLHIKECPRTCRNFVELTKSGYYDGVLFHRVVPGFVAQSGDPFGDGTGGESIYGLYFDDEIHARLAHDKRGIVSMANCGRNTNSSQFFITFDAASHLDGKHTVFGYITGEHSLLAIRDIETVKTHKKTSKPVKDVKIFSASVTNNPWENQSLPEGCSIPSKPLIQEKSKCTIQ